MPYPNRIDPETLGARALAILEANAWERWSLREVAAALGVSANALYRYVDGKDGLNIAIASAAAAALHDSLRQAVGEGEDRLVDIAHRYVCFSVERPEAFSAFAYAKPPPEHPAIAAWFAMWGEISAEIHTLLPESAMSASFAYWALLHGRAELARGPARLAAPTAGLEPAVRALIRGFEGLGHVPNPLPPHVPSL